MTGEKAFRFEQYRLGADPELFLINSSDATIVPADKYLPRKPTSYERSRDVFFDGMRAEINPAATRCREDLVGNIRRCLKKLYGDFLVGKSVDVSMKPGSFVCEKTIESAHRDAKMFGCDPDRDAYRECLNSVTVDAKKHTFRYNGGHIHIGKLQLYSGYRWGVDKKKTNLFNMPLFKKRLTTVKLLDIILGNTSVMLDRFALSKQRRELYGRAGSYREPEHGLEYRVLSNFWLIHPALSSLVFGLARLAPLIVANGREKKFFDAVDEKNVVKAINENDFELAKENFLAIKPLMLDIAKDQQYRYPITHNTMPKFEFIINNGIKNIFGFDIRKNWKINGEYHPHLMGFSQVCGWSIGRRKSFRDFMSTYKHGENNIGDEPEILDKL